MSFSRIILDTNVVLDWLVFEDASVAPIVTAIESNVITLVTSRECADELRRVLGYPEFKLAPERQDELFSRYMAVARVVESSSRSGSPLPRCSDPDDQKFLELAAQELALLVTKDRALLRLARRAQKLGVRVLRPGEIQPLLPHVAETPVA